MLDRLALDTEVVCLNDGSSDVTMALLGRLHETDPGVVASGIARNVGKAKTIPAGLDFAEGDAVFLIDSSLQDRAELIAETLKSWHGGYGVVLVRRPVRANESWRKKETSHAFCRAIRPMGPIPIPEGVGDFRLLSGRSGHPAPPARAQPLHEGSVRVDRLSDARSARPA